jgi:DNA-binding MarR family transcriptional regulator
MQINDRRIGKNCEIGGLGGDGLGSFLPPVSRIVVLDNGCLKQHLLQEMNKNTPPGAPDVRAFRAALRLLVRKISRNLRDDTACCGVGFLPCHILLELDGSTCRSLRDLEERMETDKAGLSRSVESLVGQGLVTRRQNPDNRRTVVIALTPAGRKKVAEINRISDEKYGRLFRLIPPQEHASVVCAVDYLARAFDELEGGAVGGATPQERKS